MGDEHGFACYHDANSFRRRSMSDTLEFLARGLPMLPAAVLLIVAIAAWQVTQRLLAGRPEVNPRGDFRVQMAKLVIALLTFVVFLIVIPLDAQLRGQLLSLFGIVLSAAIALASTTFVGNMMAGMMLKAVSNFRTGDFVQVGDQFGRVTGRGLLSTEIQNEHRDLVTLPNLHLVTNPVKVVRASGTLISAEVSLGYDVPHQQVEELLEAAADDAGLVDATMLVMELGDYSVVYRVVGLLQEVKHLLSVRSELRRAIMDRLHGAGVEIVSPSFMNQRALDPREAILSAPRTQPAPVDEPRMEDLAFDKADEAQSLEELSQAHTRTREAIAELADVDQDLTDEQRTRKQDVLTRRLARLETAMAEARQRVEDDD